MIGRINTQFQIVFEAYRPMISNGWIALDDISFDNCALPRTDRTCNSSEVKCTRGSCINQDRLCDLVDDCGDNSDETRPVCSSYSK